MPNESENLCALLWDPIHPLSLAAAESLTSGLLQAEIAKTSGISAHFKGGITAYGIYEKVNLLGVDHSHAACVNCVSARVAREMARGVAKLFKTDIGLATTGYAEPDPKHGVSHPRAYYSIWHKTDASKGEVRHGMLEFPGASRVEAQRLVTEAVYRELMAYLQEFRQT